MTQVASDGVLQLPGAGSVVDDLVRCLEAAAMVGRGSQCGVRATRSTSKARC